MGQLGDLYKVIQRFTFAGVECLVRRWYMQRSTLGDALAVATEWDSYVASNMASILSDDVSFKEVDVENINDVADFATVSQAPLSGAVLGDYLPTFNAFAFEFPSPSKNIRAGTMRIPGVTEDAITDGVATPAYAAALLTLAGRLADDLTPGTQQYSPMLYTPGNAKTLFVPTVFDIAGCIYRRITTQNTRKS